jgi:hypothetical protein
MSTHLSITTSAAPVANGERRHRLVVGTGYVLAVVFNLALAIYGLDYYALDAAQRPFSPKYDLLRPGGTIGIKLGFLGLLLFLAIFLYPIRKHWSWLARQGNSKHWLDIHVLMGLTAPFLIAFHASFKFRGIAGMAFWIMVAVAVSGVVGRYLYAQIPRKVSAAELSLKESREMQAQLTEQLAAQQVLSPRHLEPLFHLPDPRRVQNYSTVGMLAHMVALDLARPFRIARLRRRTLGVGGTLLTLGGLLPTRNTELERVVQTAREQAAFSKRLLFLSRSQQVFHLWHVVHKPFSYSFAVLAVVHITVVLLLGYR